MVGGNNEIFICNRFLDHFKIIDPHKSIIDVIVFDGASNVQLAGELLKIQYPNITVMRGVEHTVSIYFPIMFPKYQLSIILLQLISQYITCLALEYITNLILYSNQNNMSFTIGTLDYSV